MALRWRRSALLLVWHGEGALVYLRLKRSLQETSAQDNIGIVMVIVYGVWHMA